MIWLKDELEKRWFLHQYTNEDLFEKFEKGWQKFYFWVDPTADSLTIGHLVALMNVFNIMKRWNKCYLLVWWATWMIWNPSWKDQERPVLEEETLRKNQKWIHSQFSILAKRISEKLWVQMDFEIVNNYDFFKNMNVLDFMKDIWKNITVNWMINKDIVKKRISDPEKTISYAEFSYMLIMWYDFYHLFANEWVTLEVWWSDERDWILAWLEIIHKKTWKTAYWMTNKLLTDSTWKKFWKSEWNAIRLDPKKNTPYFVYQYLINTSDDDLEKYLKLLTFFDLKKINEIINEHKKDMSKRYWQKILAYDVVETIFGKEAIKSAQKISEILFSDDKVKILSTMSKYEIDQLWKEVWSITINKNEENKLTEICTKLWLTQSNWQTKKLIQSGWIYFNDKKIDDINFIINDKDFINWVCLIRKWKKWYWLVLNY